MLRTIPGWLCDTELSAVYAIEISERFGELSKLVRSSKHMRHVPLVDRADVEQEVILGIWRQWERAREKHPGQFEGWVLAITRNQVVNYIVASRRHSDLPRHARCERPLSPGLDLEDVFQFRNPELTDPQLWEALTHLPRNQRDTAALRYLKDWPIAWIAEELGMAEGTVKTHLSRARAAMRRALGTRYRD